MPRNSRVTGHLLDSETASGAGLVTARAVRSMRDRLDHDDVARNSKARTGHGFERE
ncbi:MAG: hypothetical protein ACJ8R9_19310 [Steroidobacteraceae bacterium]